MSLKIRVLLPLIVLALAGLIAYRIWGVELMRAAMVLVGDGDRGDAAGVTSTT